jgi:CheY-like chemotaxis protein
VLIVEDEFLVALQLEDILSDAGYMVVGIVPDQASRHAVGERPEVAFVDLNLRDGPSGQRIARQLAERFGTAIVYVTANPAQIGQPVSTAIGVVEKPFSPRFPWRGKARRRTCRPSSISICLEHRNESPRWRNRAAMSQAALTPLEDSGAMAAALIVSLDLGRNGWQRHGNLPHQLAGSDCRGISPARKREDRFAKTWSCWRSNRRESGGTCCRRTAWRSLAPSRRGPLRQVAASQLA